ncbi:MAG: hypothetical protein NC310_00685 [Roseburia sp.]|nr:hypothetical protein [Anaeroplasma bactoclasticum]MCM1195568.1 hypothetical protein [Roseburia sp.]MCM1555983.1 hypothetical protein [Anaeroplasma bactoclasticum]
MKKIAMISSIFMIIILCSCGNKAKREVVRDNPDTSIKEALLLDDVANGVSLNANLDRTKEFVDVKLLKDAKASVFYQTIDLDEYMNNRLKQIDVKILFFNGKTPSNDATSFLKEMNDKDYGITEAMLGLNFKKEEKISDVFFGKLSIKQSLAIPKDYIVKENDPTKLVVAYLPTYCTYNDGTQDYTKVYIFVPIYYAFTYASSVNSYTSGMKNYTITLTEEGTLPSQSAE